MNGSFLKSIASYRPPTVREQLAPFLSGESAYIALKKAVDELARTAPKDHDVLVEAFDLAIREVRYIKPHTLLFRGLDDQGHDSFVLCHFSQLLARVVYLPKRGARRIITGFA
ncbi:MAG: hypothetical protein ABSA97_00670 [Verrucomicrobiia bacterium]